MFFTIFIYTFFGFYSAFDTETKYYQQALTHISESSEYKSLSNGRTKYYVSNEVTSIYVMGRFYKRELQSYMETSERNYFSESVNDIHYNRELLKLGTKKCANLKIYFSEIKSNIFFSEILESPKKDKKYQDIPHFGISYVYMFQIVKGKVNLIDVKEIAYN